MSSMHWRRCARAAFVVVSLVSFGSSPAFAQSPGETDEGEPPPQGTYQEKIEVKDTLEPSLTIETVDARARELAAVAGGTSLIPAETFERGRMSTLKDVLESVPGVFVQPRFGAEEARLSIRGSGLQRTFHGRGIRLLQDGVPLNLADGGFDFQAVEPMAAKYVEVLRGANALEYGSATLGGAINYVSRSGFDASPFLGRVETGSFGYLRGQVSSGWEAGKLDGYLTLSHFSQDGFRDHSEQSTQRFLGNLGARLGDELETRFYLAAVRTDSELPGSLTRAELEADASQAAAGNVALDQKRDFDLLRLSNRTSFLLDAERRLDLGAFWASKHLDHPIFQVLDQRSNDLGFDARFETGGELWGRANRLVIGVIPVVGWLEDNRFRNVGGERGARTAEGDTTSTNVDLYAENRHQLTPRLNLALGVLVSFAGREFDDRFASDGDQSDDQSFSGTSPKLGLLFEAAPGVSVFANLSRSFEAPSFGELVNVGGDGLLALDAQSATTFEVGSRGKRGWFSWDVALYHAVVDDELLSLNDGQGNPLGTINADRTLHSGAELGLEARASRDWGSIALRQIYNWSRFKFDDDAAFGDNTLAGLPEHFLRTELTVERGRFYGGPSFEWVPSKTAVDHANTLFADAYSVIGAKVGYRGARGFGVFVEGRNLTDESYAATTGVLANAQGRDLAQFLPGDGRSVFAGFEIRR